MYSAGLTTGILFTMRDYGICDIKQIGFTLVLETTHHTYALEKTYTSVSYKNDNQFVIHIIDLQRMPITSCYLIINWVSYSPVSSDYQTPDRTIIEKALDRPKKREFEYIRKIDSARDGCEANPNSSSPRKSKLPDDAAHAAWNAYEELDKDFSEIRNLTEVVKARKPLQNADLKLSSEQIPVPINCYFDKGFYSTVYYVQDCPIIEKRLSDGKSALQCIVGVSASDLDLLLYLYYCTISQRKYFQYMTDEQKQLQEYLQKTHPVLLLQNKLESVDASFLGSEIVKKADVFVEAQLIVEEYFKNLHDIREDAYNSMVGRKQTHGKWVNEFKLFMLIKAIFPDAEYQYAADWLDQQTLDIFIPSFNCAIEYQGEQHYQAVEYFGGEGKLAEQELMDEMKRQKCADKGVKLLEWPYDLQILMPNVCSFLRGDVPDEYLEDARVEAQVSDFPINSLSDLLGYSKRTKVAIPKASAAPAARESRYEIRKYDAAGNYISSYEKIADAAEAEGLSVGGISKVIYGERRTAGGFQWKRCEKQAPKDNISAIEM